MITKKMGSMLVVRLDKGEELVSSLLQIKENIAKMKDGVIIINNSRGQIVAEPDLADALNSGKVAAAALDVVSTEPIRSDNPLLRAKNCIITPHISWAPKESRQRIMDTTADNIRAWLDGHPINVVNGCVPS